MLANLVDLKRLGVKVIDFTGGEPLLHQQLPDFLAVAKRMGFITTVTTNTLLYPKMAHRLKGIVDMLHFSVDSFDEANHNASRGIECYAFLLRSMKIAKELGEKPDLLLTVTNDNVGDIEPIYRNWIVPNKLRLILNPIFSYNDVGSDLASSHFPRLRYWARQPRVYLNEAFLTLREQGGNHINDPVCQAASTTIVISPDDHLVLPCYHLGLDQFPIQGKLHDLWKSQVVQSLVQLEGRHKECESCTVNCYMQPSFATQISPLFLKALPSTIKYSFEKWVLS
jgi:MoaA/NifB/PqqE/SkfB family radical SAM enzyme